MATAERSFLFRATFCGEHKIRICADSLPQLFANFSGWHCFLGWRHKNAIKHKECGGRGTEEQIRQWDRKDARINTVTVIRTINFIRTIKVIRTINFPLSTFPQLITRVCIIGRLSFNLVSTLDRIQCVFSAVDFNIFVNLKTFCHFFLWLVTLMHMQMGCKFLLHTRRRSWKFYGQQSYLIVSREKKICFVAF